MRGGKLRLGGGDVGISKYIRSEKSQDRLLSSVSEGGSHCTAHKKGVRHDLVHIFLTTVKTNIYHKLLFQTI